MFTTRPIIFTCAHAHQVPSRAVVFKLWRAHHSPCACTSGRSMGRPPKSLGFSGMITGLPPAPTATALPFPPALPFPLTANDADIAAEAGGASKGPFSPTRKVPARSLSVRPLYAPLYLTVRMSPAIASTRSAYLNERERERERDNGERLDYKQKGA